MPSSLSVLTPCLHGTAFRLTKRKLYAHMAEVYAAALSHADYNIGRVIDAIDQLGELDNTLIIYIMGDNGCSGESTCKPLPTK
jgi:arylsulfatase A-like enzyme